MVEEGAVAGAAPAGCIYAASGGCAEERAVPRRKAPRASPREPAQLQRSIAEEDEADADGSDSDFGVSDRQLKELRRRQTKDASSTSSSSSSTTAEQADDEEAAGASPGVLDPLRNFAERRRSTVEAAGSFAERRRSSVEAFPPSFEGTIKPMRALLSCSSMDEFIEEQLPRRRCEKEYSHARVSNRLESKLMSCQELHGVTWYIFRIIEGEEYRFYMKRYNDFRELDCRIQSQQQPPGFVMPMLPPAGRFGLRHKLDIGDFNAKRAAGLSIYVASLLEQTRSLQEDPALTGFFGRGAPGRVRYLPTEDSML